MEKMIDRNRKMVICRMCQCESISLQKSHIIPKMFFNVIKKNSPTGFMREITDPNHRIQDGLKIPFLCKNCEELFSKYETYFSNEIYTKTVENKGEICFDSKDAKISYFLLSIAWRVIQFTIENEKTTFTSNEMEKIYEIVEKWRVLLHNEDLKEIQKIQQFIIPTKNLKFFQTIQRRIWDNVMIDFSTYDEENTFKFAFTIVQVPYFIFITTVWGHTDTMKQYKLGGEIKPRKSELPQNITKLLENKFVTEFLKSYERLTEKQKK